MDKLLIDTVRDPRWFPLRFDVQKDTFQFTSIPAELHRAVTFLADVRPADVRGFTRAAVNEVAVSEAPLHLILHSGLGGSTLLARALAQPGVVTTLKEPPILTDVIAFGLKRADPRDQRQLLLDATRLLSRPLTPGEAVVVKMSSIGNGLSTGMAERRPSSRLLCMQTPLELMLASLASRGDEGRQGGRRLFIGMRNARMIGVAAEDNANELQLTALAWLSIQKIMLEAIEALGPSRVRSLASERLMAEPREAIDAISSHFGLSLDVEARLASGVFGRHAKTGQPFDARSRAQRMNAALREHGEEINAVVGWARKVADANSIAWDLPYPLLD